MGDPEVHQPPGEAEQGQVLVPQAPVVPGDVVVLAVGVVVPPLAAAHLVAAEQHGYALGQEQGAEEVPPLADADLADLLVVGVALGPAVPRAVVALAVAVALAVGLIVALVVG